MADTTATPVRDVARAFDEFVYATLTQRFFAYVIDYLFVVCLFFFLRIALMSETRTVIPVFSDLTLVNVSFAFCLMLYRFLAHLSFGQTIGKRVLGIEVVLGPGSKSRFIAILLRDTVGFIVSCPFGIGYWWGSPHLTGKAWSDIIAGTLVRDRG
jgi:uncharacterized RDD family membrane protein YckC